MIKTVTGIEFTNMFISGAAAVENSRQEINELNVFPVPDGDTGINMSLSMNTAVTELRKKNRARLGDAAQAAAGGLLRGARGNSGVILSLLFRGFARHVKDLTAMDGADFALALADGVEAAYRAVMKPAEGTMLTVSRVCAAKSKDYALSDNTLEGVMTFALKSAEEALTHTVEQNPVLKKAGVVDAGGKGFCVILAGMLSALQGSPVAVVSTESAEKAKADFSEYASEDITFAYCTEFIILRKPAKREPIKLRAFLGALGDSLVFVDDESIIKVHVHTNNPGKALEEALCYGALSAIKIENMREQHTEAVVRQDTPKPAETAAPEKRYGFVSVCAGEGLKAVMTDLGVDRVVEGGQTMNPSTEDILREVNLTAAEVVFVLPNNKNIIMAAEQCAPLTSKSVVVLPSKSIPQGIGALLAFDAEAETDPNREAMIAAMTGISSGAVTYAARNSTYDDREISEGDFMALLENKLLVSHRDISHILDKLAREMSKKDPSYITVFYGQDISEEDAQKASAHFERLCPSAEVHLLPGGQPVYYYLVSAE